LAARQRRSNCCYAARIPADDLDKDATTTSADAKKSNNHNFQLREKAHFGTRSVMGGDFSSGSIGCTFHQDFIDCAN
jgi:hypothetical protein